MCWIKNELIKLKINKNNIIIEKKVIGKIIIYKIDLNFNYKIY